MTKWCDNKSVGVVIRGGERTLLIKRKNYPVAYALVAGHLDGDTPLDGAVKETHEEVGLEIQPKRFRERIADLKLANPCKRDGGDGHEWWVYEVDAPNASIKAGSDAREVMWVTPEEFSALVQRTEAIATKCNVAIEDLARSTPAIVSDPEWIANPGLEPVWVVLFKHLQS